MTAELPLTFSVAGTTVIGILHLPDMPPRAGAVIVVGGPQYRVGSHRQFLLLARHLADHGVAALRFDCRGMGDGAGDFPGFENIGPDVASAIDSLAQHAPSVRQIFLWGLCDATLAICRHAAHDPRVAGVALLNPWVRTEAGQARAQLKHYYIRRLADPELLRKILRGHFNPVASLRSLADNVYLALHARPSTFADSPVSADSANHLAQQMADALGRFRGNMLLILSGRDLTAKEFQDTAKASKPWRALYVDERMTLRHLADSDHTFSRRAWRDQVAAWTLEWITGQAARDH